jgi:type IX secretion system PorP/SprF family membrane protein
MKTLKIVLVLVITSCSLILNAQQAPMYTHYMNNTLSLNPAYAGSRDALTLTALHRSQWVGFAGAPVTQTFTAHSPLRNEHVGLGLTVLNDKIGPTNNTSVFIDYAYIIKLNVRSKLAFGLSAGVNIYNANLNTLQLDQQTDPSFINNVNNHATPNFGFGAYYSRERFYAGISAPNLLQNSYLVNEQAGVNTIIGKEQRHFFLIAGALFNLTEKLAFKPTTLIKLTSGAPVQADLTASFIILKRLLVGAMWRTGDSFGGLIGFDITEQLHLGYSYDWSYGLRTGVYNHGSHELMLRYDIIFLGKKQIHSPRNF